MARRALTARGQVARLIAIAPALVGIFLLGQGVLDRLGWRWDLTPERRYTASARLREIAAALPDATRIVAFQRSQDPRNARTREMLQQLQRVTSRLTVEIVDVNRNPSLARSLGVATSGGMVVESGSRRRVISQVSDDIVAAALLQVTRQERRVVGWVVGHGEGDPWSNDRYRGWSLARRALEAEWYEVRPVSLGLDGAAHDVDALVIAAPRQDWLDAELADLDRHLRRGGAVLVMLDPGRVPRCVQALARWGIAFGDDVIVDPAGALHEGEHVTMRLTVARDEHPIVGPLDVAPLFAASRSVSPAPGDAIRVQPRPFLRTSRESWAAAGTTPRPVFDPTRDRRGPIVVGLETVFEVPSEPGQPVRHGRIIGFGNGDFASNFFFDYLGNKDLFVNAVAWLTHDEHALGQRARAHELGKEQFFVSAEDGQRTFWVLGVLQPLALASIGLVLAWRRRRQ